MQAGRGLGALRGRGGALRINDPEIAAIITLGWGRVSDIRVNNASPLLILLGGRDHIHEEML